LITPIGGWIKKNSIPAEESSWRKRQCHVVEETFKTNKEQISEERSCESQRRCGKHATKDRRFFGALHGIQQKSNDEGINTNCNRNLIKLLPDHWHEKFTNNNGTELDKIGVRGGMD
jgi:hypothetical protein